MKLLFALGFCVIGAVALAQEDAAALLKRTMDRDVRYIGTRTVEFRRGPRPDQHQEYVTRDGDRLRIEFPKGSPMEGQIIVEDGTERRHFFPETNEIHVLPPRREEAFWRIGKLVKSKSRFKISFGPDTTVAGKDTQQVVVADPSGNVMQRIFIERSSGVILRRDFFDPVGTKVGGFEFDDISLNPRIDRRVFTLTRRGARIVTPMDMMQDAARKEGFRPLSLPEKNGVQLEWAGARDFGGNPVLIQNYVSPSGRLTLFQLKRIVSADLLRGFSRGKANFVYWRREGRTFVLIGEQDGETLRRLAQPISLGTPIIGP